MYETRCRVEPSGLPHQYPSVSPHWHELARGCSSCARLSVQNRTKRSHLRSPSLAASLDGRRLSASLINDLIGRFAPLIQGYALIVVIIIEPAVVVVAGLTLVAGLIIVIIETPFVEPTLGRRRWAAHVIEAAGVSSGAAAILELAAILNLRAVVVHKLTVATEASPFLRVRRTRVGWGRVGGKGGGGGA